MSTAKRTAGFANIYSSSEDEDVCPTCLEEYTAEDPKIMTKCSHHFHLACIYEWMERSDNCPVCGKINIWRKERLFQGNSEAVQRGGCGETSIRRSLTSECKDELAYFELLSILSLS